MRIANPRFLLAAVLAACYLLSARAAEAQPPAAPSWHTRLGFSYLATTGNSETASAGLEAGFHRAWRTWTLEGSANGVSASKRHRRTAESYHAQARLRRRLRRLFHLTLGGRWERNRFAGLDSRQIADVSLLWQIRETPDWKLSALAGLSIGREDPRGDRPVQDSFGGLLQVHSDARISASASWDSQVTLFPNFNDANDYRLHGRLGLQAALNRHLGLRLGYDLKFDNEPVAGFGTTDTATTASLVLQLGQKEK